MGDESVINVALGFLPECIEKERFIFMFWTFQMNLIIRHICLEKRLLYHKYIISSKYALWNIQNTLLEYTEFVFPHIHCVLLSAMFACFVSHSICQSNNPSICLLEEIWGY